MKTERIIKALRCCATNSCEGCPLDDLRNSKCIGEMAAAAADEIEKLLNRCARYAEEIMVLQERQRWIPAEERLPEEGVPVFINYIGTDGAPHADGVVVWAERAALWWEGSLADCDTEVSVPITHWMPLPAPPEVE